MIWFAGPVLLAAVGLTGPALLCFALVCAVRLTRSIGFVATVYGTVILATGWIVG